MDKPTWDTAPDWAEYLAQDEDGMFWWFESKPEWFDAPQGGHWWVSTDYRAEPAVWVSNWRESLEKRPEREKGMVK